MKHLLTLFFIISFASSCGGIKTGIPKVGHTPGDLNYGEYIQSEPSLLPYNERVIVYVNRYNEIAKEEMRKYKIPASITLAQGILESSAGNGTLAIKSNNHFGIKCHKDWKGSTVSHDDDAYGECFRKYKSPESSFEDHSIFLVERQRYAPLFKLDPGDYRAWATGLKAAGYATDPKYPAKLIRLIETFELYKYDDDVLKKSKSRPQQIEMKNENDDEKKWQRTTNLEVESQNHWLVHVIQKGDTLYSLARKYSTSVNEIRKINNLADNSLSIGQKLKIKLTNL